MLTALGLVLIGVGFSVAFSLGYYLPGCHHYSMVGGAVRLLARALLCSASLGTGLLLLITTAGFGWPAIIAVLAWIPVFLGLGLQVGKLIQAIG